MCAHPQPLRKTLAQGYERITRIPFPHPYAGGFITRSNGDARGTRQSVQIEINRALYMDGTARLDQARTATLRRQIGALGRFLADTMREAA